jgi:hypothetical protein
MYLWSGQKEKAVNKKKAMTIENSRWDKEKMFFLTKEEQVEITSYEELFNCANQCLIDYDVDVDRFGRNRVDVLFVRLCMAVHSLFSTTDFESLSCKKHGNIYRVRVEWSNGGILDMELSALVEVVEHQCMARKQI